MVLGCVTMGSAIGNRLVMRAMPGVVIRSTTMTIWLKHLEQLTVRQSRDKPDRRP